jgi:transcriptional regulatory protein GAL4
MAYGLGLHKDHPSVEGNLLYREIRRRTWWCLFIFDAGSTITFSRPLAIPSAGINTKLPFNILESELTASTKIAPANLDVPTIYTNVRVQSQFHLLTNHIYNRVISKPSPTAKQVLEWDDFYISKWLNLVPDYYKETATVPERHQFPHAIMTWRYKHFRLIIYRPFFIQKALQINQQQTASLTAFPIPIPKPSPDQPYIDKACERCLKESHETIISIDNFWHSAIHTRMACWYALYFLFSATLVPVILLHNEPQSPHSEGWQEDIDKAIAIIKTMVELSPFASRCYETLERLRDGFSSPVLAELGSMVPEMPSFSDPVGQESFVQMFSGNNGWFEGPEVYFEEQMW